MPDQPTFEIEARAVTARESENGAAPDWAEISLGISNPFNRGATPPNSEWLTSHEWLTRSAGHAIIEALRDVLSPGAERSIREMIWGELDEVMDYLMDAAGEPISDASGQALGLATALAILTNPFAFDIDAIREEALARWESRSAAS